jgi:hypothetical protein
MTVKKNVFPVVVKSFTNTVEGEENVVSAGKLSG